MREIKFRGRRKDSGKEECGWVYGDLVRTHEGGSVYIQYYEGLLYKRFEVTEETVGQYTGLKDRSGREIYEGDILRVFEYDNQAKAIGGTWQEREEYYDTFTLDELKGQVDREYVTPVGWEEGTFCIGSYGPDSDGRLDTYLGCLFGDMRRSYPIFEFEVIGNVHDDPDVTFGRMFTREGCR